MRPTAAPVDRVHVAPVAPVAIHLADGQAAAVVAVWPVAAAEAVAADMPMQALMVHKGLAARAGLTLVTDNVIPVPVVVVVIMAAVEPAMGSVRRVAVVAARHGVRVF